MWEGGKKIKAKGAAGVCRVCCPLACIALHSLGALHAQHAVTPTPLRTLKKGRGGREARRDGLRGGVVGAWVGLPASAGQEQGEEKPACVTRRVKCERVVRQGRGRRKHSRSRRQK